MKGCDNSHHSIPEVETMQIPTTLMVNKFSILIEWNITHNNQE